MLLEADSEHQEHISGVNNEPVILTSNTDLMEEAGSQKKIFGQIQNASTNVDAMMNTDEDQEQVLNENIAAFTANDCYVSCKGMIDVETVDDGSFHDCRGDTRRLFSSDDGTNEGEVPRARGVHVECTRWGSLACGKTLS